MTRWTTFFSALTALVGIAGCGAPSSSGDGGIDDDVGSDVSVADGGHLAGCAPGLPADLCFLREEEKLARDVYLALFEQTGIAIFDNIRMSEQTHTDAVAALLDARAIPDPVTDDTPGAFTDSTFDTLYADSTAAGSESDVAALRVGATIEDLDLHDIESMRARTTDTEAHALYDSLACGSRNHLRSFVEQLSSRGETYTVAYIPEASFAAIVGSPRERCGP